MTTAADSDQIIQRRHGLDDKWTMVGLEFRGDSVVGQTYYEARFVRDAPDVLEPQFESTKKGPRLPAPPVYLRDEILCRGDLAFLKNALVGETS